MLVQPRLTAQRGDSLCGLSQVLCHGHSLHVVVDSSVEIECSERMLPPCTSAYCLFTLCQNLLGPLKLCNILAFYEVIAMAQLGAEQASHTVPSPHHFTPPSEPPDFLCETRSPGGRPRAIARRALHTRAGASLFSPGEFGSLCESH